LRCKTDVLHVASRWRHPAGVSATTGGRFRTVSNRRHSGAPGLLGSIASPSLDHLACTRARFHGRQRAGHRQWAAALIDGGGSAGQSARMKGGGMTGSTVGLIIIPIVAVIPLAAWIILVFYADAHPTWRGQAPSGHGPADPAARATAGKAEESPGLVSGEMEASPAARQEAGAPAERAATIAPDKTRAA
jgi:hypothetical protein